MRYSYFAVLILSTACWSQPQVNSSRSFLPNLSPISLSTAIRHARPLPAFFLGLIEDNDKDDDKPPKTTGQKVWAVLNSSFGLWVLSSVLLAWITKAYSTREAHKAEILKKIETASRIDTEIAFRLAMSLDGLRINEARLASSPTTPRGIHQSAYDYLENVFIQSGGRDFSVFPEYQKRTFRSLLLELRTVIDPHEEGDLKQALDAYEELSEGGDIGSEDSSPEACHQAFTEVRRLLEGRLVRHRWKGRVHFLNIRKKGA